MTNTRLTIEVSIIQKWDTVARRNVNIDAESIEEIDAVAVDMAPALAILVRKVIDEVKDAAQDDKAE